VPCDISRSFKDVSFLDPGIWHAIFGRGMALGRLLGAEPLYMAIAFT
jgi:hypothetical protein